MPDLRLLVLFGSAARDRASSESDIDLAVQCDGPADLDAFYLALAPRLGTDRLDLIEGRSEEHTSELQSRSDLVCRLLLEKKNKDILTTQYHKHILYCYNMY